MTIVSDKNRVRLMISDVGGMDGDSFLFSDSEIETFLELRGDNVNRAAALALRTIAGNEAQVSKRIKFLELQTDGPGVAAELRALADTYEAQDDEDADWEVAQLGVTPSNRRVLRHLETDA
jgi:hypothetical protein